MFRFRIATPWGVKEDQATPIKEDLDTSQGFFLRFSTSTHVHFVWETSWVTLRMEVLVI